jgi:undecaprenyl-diphosphatase
MENKDFNLKDLSWNQLLVLFISLLSLIGFLFVALLKSSFVPIDVNVNSWSASIQMSSLTQIAEIVAYCFDTTPLLAASLLIATCLFYKNYKKNAFLLLGAMGGDAAIITAVKTLVHSERPLNGIMQDTGFSFPSGHVTSSVVFFGLLTYFVFQYWESSNRKTLSSMFSVAIAILVGFDRLYLNVHWFSDVLGGYLLGVFWLTFSILVFQYLERTAKFQMKHANSLKWDLSMSAKWTEKSCLVRESENNRDTRKISDISLYASFPLNA